MLLKRHYKRGAEGNLLSPASLASVEVFHAGVNPEQHFSSGLIDAGVLEGWISLGQGKITLHTKPENLVYAMKRTPGRYCCHCNEKLPDDATGEAARSHVKLFHPGETSPDPQNPSGYCMLNHYQCVLDASQHDKWKVAQDSFSAGTLRHTRKMLSGGGR